MVYLIYTLILYMTNLNWFVSFSHLEYVLKNITCLCLLAVQFIPGLMITACKSTMLRKRATVLAVKDATARRNETGLGVYREF